jgi:hypothetical protein
MRLAGKTQAEIARAVGISEATVRDDLKRLQELWKERIQNEQADLRAQIVAELDDTRLRALEAAEWDQLCERAVLFDDLPEDTATTLEGQPAKRSIYRDAKGSAQFRGNKAGALQAARQATMDKAKVLGLVVDKVAPTNAAGDDIPLAELMERFSRSQESATEPPPGSEG